MVDDVRNSSQIFRLQSSLVRLWLTPIFDPITGLFRNSQSEVKVKLYSLASHLGVPVVDILVHTEGADLDIILVNTAAHNQGLI